MERPAGFLGSRALTGCLFAVYLAFLAWIVLLKGQFSLEVAGTMRSVNLVPLAGATVINGAADYREAVENLLAFLPFGLYLGMLAGHRPLWRGVAVVAAVSLGFEVLQFAYAMGASDVTDLLANTVGGALDWASTRSRVAPSALTGARCAGATPWGSPARRSSWR